MFLESERLIIREARVEDAPFYFKMYNDPDWIKYINDKGLKTVEETEAHLKDVLLKNSKLNGLGFYTVVLKETNEIIGTTSALQREKLEYIDIGYAFLPKGRGKGYAKEAAQLTMGFIKDKFQQEKVYAFTLPENGSSKRLLESLGFVFIGMKTVFEGEEDCVFEYVF